MPTPGERRALIFIASVAALGVAVRGWRDFHPQDPAALAGNRTALARQIEAVDSAIAVTSSKRKQRAPRVDAPRTDPAPRVAAERIRKAQPRDTAPRDPREAYWARAAHFDSIREGIDPASRSRGTRRSEPLSDARHPPSQPPSTFRRLPPSPTDLDVADVDQIAAIPLIGQALARRIVADRIEFGPFGSLAELERVPGIGPALTRRLAPFVTFSRSPRLGSAGERRPEPKKGRRPGGESRP